MKRLTVLALLVALVTAGAAGAQRSGGNQLRIYAAASLTEVFQKFDRAQQYNFGGSNQLATQIRQGAPADLFASASPDFTQALFGQNLVEKPLTFASNRLVLAVPKSNPAGIHSVYDLRRKNVKLVVGTQRRCRSARTRASCCASSA